jgi:hypothetical protein
MMIPKIIDPQGGIVRIFSKMAMAVVVTSVCLWASTTQTDTRSTAEKIRQQNIEVVAAAAKSLNESLPKKVDDFTTLTRIEPQGEKLIYVFKIDAGPKSDAELIKEGKARMTRNVTAGLCQSSARFLKSGITMIYRYVSAHTGKRLFDVTVTKASCPQLMD